MKPILLRSTGVLVTGALALVLFGCGSKHDDSSPAPNAEPTPIAPLTAFPSIKQTLGASGGTIEGAAGTIFEGVKLVIPDGALASDTEVTITQSEDTTPLPVGARRIGVQFTIGPSSATLAKPASLTMPAVNDEVMSYDSQPSDMKVWRRDGDAWARSEPTATEEGRVTIDLPAFTTVAPGVKLTTIPPPCGAACYTAETNPCITGVGICVRNFGAITPVPDDSGFSFTDTKGWLGWTSSNSSGTKAVAKYVNTIDGFHDDYVTYTSQSVFGLDYGRRNPSIDFHHGPDYWVATNLSGQVNFRFDGQPAQVFGTMIGEGAVSTANYFAWFAGGMGHRIFPAGSVSDYWGPLNFDAAVRIVPPLEAATGSDTVVTLIHGAGSFSIGWEDARYIPGGPPPGGWLGTRVDGVAYEIDTDVDGTIGVEMRDSPTSPMYIALYKDGAKTRAVGLPDGLNIAHFAFDGAGGMWISPVGVAQLWHRSAAGEMKSVLLTSEASGTPGYVQHMANRILHQGFAGKVFVVTLGKELLGVSNGYK